MKTLSEDKIDFIMGKIIDFKIDVLDYDGIRDILEDTIKVCNKDTALSFRDWCIDKQQPFVRNGYQGLDTSELWNEYSTNPLTHKR